ncbi:Beta-galactosidase BoGH2A, partial [termite gut metagenome]
MKTKVVWAVILLVLFPKCAYSQLSFGQPEKINDEWRFILKDVDGAQSPNYNDTRWQNVDLPHDWSIKESLSPTLASATGYLPGGIG